MHNTPCTILGIDPGYDRVGYCVASVFSSQFSVLNYGTIQTDKKQNLSVRYQQIVTELTALIKEFKPTQLAIETVLFSVNKKTAMRVAEAKGIITGVCLSQGLQIYEYNPREIKLSITGNGNADKQAVAKILNLELKLNSNKELDDALDAIAVAYSHKLLCPVIV